MAREEAFPKPAADAPLVAGEQISGSRSIDLMSNPLWDARRFYTFSAIDDFSREAFAVEVDLNLLATRVICTMERIAARSGHPAEASLGQWPRAQRLGVVAVEARKSIVLGFLEPGRQIQNDFIERFNGSFRRGVSDMRVFRNLGEVCGQAEQWVADCNTEMPHDSLGGLTPAAFR